MDKRDTCKDDVIKKYESYTSLVRHVANDQLKMIRGQCQSACGAGADSSCVAECEMEMYSCIDHTLPNEMEKRGKSQEDVLKKFKKFQEKWASAKPGEGKHFFLNTTHDGVNDALTEEQRAVIKKKCAAACGSNADSHCYTGCEVEMYACIDHTLPNEMDKRETCKDDVIKKYESYTSLVRHVANDQLKMIRGQCQSACGAGADSSCVTECEMEMYSCIDHTLPNEMEKRGKCQEDVLKKSKKFQEKWASAKPGEGKHFFLNTTHDGVNDALTEEQRAVIKKFKKFQEKW